MIRVFISYAGKDKGFASKLAEDLRASGVKVWVDFWEIQVGDSIIEKIHSAISGSDFVVAVLSQNSINSKWVQEELNSAKMREIESGRRLLLPVLIDDSPLPSLLAHKRFADFRSSYENGLKDLLAGIGVEQLSYFQSIGEAVTLRELVARVLTTLVSRFRVHSIHFLVRAAESHAERLIMVGAALDAYSQRFRYAAMSGMIGQAYRGGTQVYAHDVAKADRYFDADGRTASEVANPIRLPTGQIIGVINVESGKKDAFSPLDLEFMQRVAEAIGWWFSKHKEQAVDAQAAPYWELAIP